MNSIIHRTLASIAFLALSAAAAHAVIVPFVEEFNSDASNWREGTGVSNAAWSPNGGPGDSAHVFSTFSFANSQEGDTPVLLRGHDNFGSSGGAFVGDWLAAGVTEFSAYVRHDAPVPLNYFVRFAKPANFPGAIGVEFVPVFPNTWTRIDIGIFDGNPEFINFETSDFDTIFSGIGKLQLGVEVPAALAGNPAGFTFGFDAIAIVPEPASLALLGLAGLVALRRRR